MTKIGADSLTNVAYGQVSDPTKFHLPCADRTAGGDGTGKDLTFAVLYQCLAYRLLTATSHGLVSGDVGKPLSGAAIFDDTDPAHTFSCVLVEIVNSNTLRVATVGTEVSIAVGLLTNGASYDHTSAGDGRYVFWDESMSLYVPEAPGDTDPTAREILEILSVGVSTFTARVL